MFYATETVSTFEKRAPVAANTLRTLGFP